MSYPRTLIRRSTVVVAAIFVALAIISGWLGLSRLADNGDTSDTLVVSPIPVVPRPDGDAGALSIVVLPFANQTGDPQNAYVADALTVAITADLARIRGVYVAPVPIAYGFQGKGLALADIARSAGVGLVLQGSLISAGAAVRISVQLVNAATGVQMQNANFEGASGNLYSVQSQVTAMVGNAIAGGGSIEPPSDAHAIVFGSKAAELRMNALALRVNAPSTDNWQQIESLHRQVLKMEPANSTAMSDLAYCLTASTVNLLFSPNTDRHLDERLQEAHALAVKALLYDLDDANAHTVLGLIAQRMGDLVTALREFERKVELEPKDADSYRLLGEVLTVMGKTDQAIEALRKADALNPRGSNDSLLFDLGVAYFNRGDNDAAIGWMEKAFDANPNGTKVFAYLAMAYANRGDKAKAQEWATWAAAAPYRMGSFNPPTATSSAAYREIWGAKMVNAWHLAGLPD